jgi:hypothetical protein
MHSGRQEASTAIEACDPCVRLPKLLSRAGTKAIAHVQNPSPDRLLLVLVEP